MHHYHYFIPFQISHFLMLKRETFSLKVIEDRLVFNNCTAEVQEAVAEECLAKLVLSPAQQKQHILQSATNCLWNISTYCHVATSVAIKP